MQSTNTLNTHSPVTTMPERSGHSQATALANAGDERDAGPWLALTALVSLALTAVFVIIVSKWSF